MATKKPKASSKTTKSKTTKPKTAAKTVTKPVSEASKTQTVEREVITSTKGKSIFSGFFARKYEEKESILTVFKNHKFYGALLGEVLGSMLITLFLFALGLMGVASAANYSFLILAVFIAIYSLSGACINPIITVGMMASRRISVIRGVMYLIAQVLGAWLGWVIFNAFHLAGGETAYEIPKMTAIGENQFWVFAMVELLGAIVIAFFFARALKYKRSVFTFAATTAGGIVLAMLIGFVVSAAFVGVQNNFVYNPAAALMFQIFPDSGDSFGAVLGGICQALSVYAFLPMIGGVVGFYLSDFMGKLSGEE